MAEFHLADFAGKHEFDLAAADFFVELHRGKQPFVRVRTELRARRQARTFEQRSDARCFALRQAQMFRGDPCGSYLAY